jgi:hypothetical protein
METSEAHRRGIHTVGGRLCVGAPAGFGGCLAVVVITTTRTVVIVQ